MQSPAVHKACVLSADNDVGTLRSLRFMLTLISAAYPTICLLEIGPEKFAHSQPRKRASLPWITVYTINQSINQSINYVKIKTSMEEICLMCGGRLFQARV